MVRAIFNRIMEDIAFWAVDGEDPESYHEMVRIMKDVNNNIIDDKVSEKESNDVVDKLMNVQLKLVFIKNTLF